MGRRMQCLVTGGTSVVSNTLGLDERCLGGWNFRRQYACKAAKIGHLLSAVRVIDNDYGSVASIINKSP